METYPADEITGMSALNTDQCQEVRARARAFALGEIEPHSQEWDEAGTFPRELFGIASRDRILGAGFPESYGGAGGDIFDKLIVKEELARFGCGGVRAGLLSLGIALPPILAVGSDELKARIAPAVLAGEKIIALAITEPEGGSDVANLRTTARRDGEHYVVQGVKTYITSGVRADFFVVAVRTGGAGRAGLSLLVIETGMPGFRQERVPTMGWWSSDTGRLTFDGVRVPRENLVGVEHDGFMAMMLNFNEERLGNIAIVLGAAKACYDLATTYARRRVVFEKPLIANQVVRHKLVDMATRILLVESGLQLFAQRYASGEQPGPQIAMLKNAATAAYEFCASEAVQIHGGAGIARTGPVERLFRESKILSIGGGSVEVLKDLVARRFRYESSTSSSDTPA